LIKIPKPVKELLQDLLQIKDEPTLFWEEKLQGVQKLNFHTGQTKSVKFSHLHSSIIWSLSHDLMSCL